MGLNLFKLWEREVLIAFDGAKKLRKNRLDLNRYEKL